MPLLEMTQPIIWLVLAWLFAVGGCIGSFMNVVIYRLPAGLSLLHPPSRCPVCETRIRATDNVPIFGWLWLRGRCRSCGAAISARYPAVELLVALLFVGLAWVEPLSGGSNLPSQSRTPAAELWGVYAYHLFLLCSLICAAFTELDGHRLTWRLALPALATGLLAPLVWPHLRPTTQTPASMQSWVALLDGLIGVAAGGLSGLAISVILATKARLSAVTEQMSPKPLEQLDLPRPDAALALAWVGAFLGWPAAIAIAMASITMFALHRSAIGRLIPALNRLGLLSHIAAWTLIWIILWRQIHTIMP